MADKSIPQSGFTHASSAGRNAILCALVFSLLDSGALNRDTFIETLRRLWIAMPDDEALEDPGAAIEQMLAALDGEPGRQCDEHRDADGVDGTALVRMPARHGTAA